MKKISTLKLLGLLAILVLIYAATEFFSNTGRSKSFRQELVAIDTAAVSRVEIDKDGTSLEIYAEGKSWKVSSNKGRLYNAEDERVKGMLSSLQTIKPSRIASRNKEKWQEFQVDSTGTRVKVFENKKKTLDLVIGRFAVKGQQQFYSYVRLFDEDNIYVADNFMGFSVPTDENSYRNQTITNINRDSISAVRFEYPADSSFSLTKSIRGKWLSESFEPDSTKSQQFINSLSRLSSSKFDNESNVAGLTPLFNVVIDISDQASVELNAFAKTDSTYLLISSQNQGGQFDDLSIFDRIFKSRSDFLTGDGE
jgi:hypothetical protein